VFVLAADLQDPPELISELLTHWRQGARVVWAVRRQRNADGRVQVALSTLYHALARSVGGARGLPAGGAGCCFFDRQVVEALLDASQPPVDLFVAACRLRVSSATVVYDRSPRRHGRSGWSAGKKLRFALRTLAAGRRRRRELHLAEDR
jgi:dolichol-phosphate mannosyltransferase